ncbi:HrgA protein, partial [Candidatus Woesearchaeota archaeon]
MANKLTFLDLAELILEKIRKPLSVSEIWSTAVELGLADKISTSGKTPWKTMGAQIYLDIRDNPNTKFFQYSKRPARFYLKKYSSESFVLSDSEQSLFDSRKKFQERDLHPLLVKFANANVNFKAHLKTIFHESSSKNKKGFNKWLHPDIVGVYFPFSDFNEATLRLQESLSINSVKLFSFELKIKLDLSNLRESYFQAVSNSSWANEGYLVALNISEDPDFLD